MTCVLSPEAWSSLKRAHLLVDGCHHCNSEINTWENYIGAGFSWVDMLFGHYPPARGDFDKIRKNNEV